MKIVAFAGSNSSKSINHKLIQYVVRKITDVEIEILRLTEFNIPMYGIDLEKEGFSNGVIDLHDKIQEAYGVIISVAEHNGNITAFFKSIIDWLSRFNRTFLDGKKILLISTAPGERGGTSALAIAHKTLAYFKPEIIASHSFGNFNKIFEDGKVVDDNAKEKLNGLIKSFLDKLLVN